MTRLIGLNRPEGVEREEHDFYATHPSALPCLLRLLNFTSPKLIRETSCGQGHLGLVLELMGHKVVATDLIDRGYGVPNVNFLERNPLFDTINYDAVIMNPPYKHARDFVEKSLTLAPIVAAFLRINFLESENREEFFKTNPPSIVAIFSRRVKCAKYGKFDDSGSSPVLYAWFIWEKGYSGEPKIKWVQPEETPYVLLALELIQHRCQLQSETES